MTNVQLYLAIAVPIFISGLLFVCGFVIILAKLNHLEVKVDANFNLLFGRLMEIDSRLSKVEAKLGSSAVLK